MVKNQEIAKRILQIIDTLIEGAYELHTIYSKKDYVEFENISIEMIMTLQSIHKYILPMKMEESSLNTDLECESIIDSLKHIVKLSYARAINVKNKIEFELIPLLEEMKMNFYYWACIYPNKELMKEYYKSEVIPLSSNKYIDEAEERGEYKYELSVFILAYNKLEYTKLCVESLLKYIPKNINYELILINHGSSDGTKEFFETIAPTKQLNISKNGGGLLASSRIVEGKYILSISNDVLVTENAIENMIKCMESDDKIVKVVPSTPNISNFQSIDAEYKSINEMYEFSKKNNLSNKFRWEQRARLCDPISMIRSSVALSSKGLAFGRQYTSSNIKSFPDDTVSLVIRRSGYKSILAKDAYCYHFGHVTLRDEILKYEDNEGNVGQDAFFNEGRKQFYDMFGIDPWGVGRCWEPELFVHLPCLDNGHVDILGINCGIGSNPLKVKESIKENTHNLDVTIYNVTDEECYIDDLKGVSDFAEYINDCSRIKNTFEGKKFKYIIFESKFETYENPLILIESLEEMLLEDGIIAIKTDNAMHQEIKKRYVNSIQSESWIILK